MTWSFLSYIVLVFFIYLYCLPLDSFLSLLLPTYNNTNKLFIADLPITNYILYKRLVVFFF